MNEELTLVPSLSGSTNDGEGLGVVSYCAAAFRNNGLGRYADALIASERAQACPQEPGFAALVLPELIEGACRSGQSGRALEALEQLNEAIGETGTAWVRGIGARSRGLMAESRDAERHYRQAIHLLGSTGVQVDLARAHLLYGEWLRRANRRLDARRELRIAEELFTVLHVEPFAERTRRELLATGETARKRTPDTRATLTGQEAHIAYLVAHGHTNREIGSELFLSARTVEWHLRKIFLKLGLNSRRELRTRVHAGHHTDAVA
jgi:DNA-binding CsgD family transcriptional regulator